jgi:hypothetical protein
MRADALVCVKALQTAGGKYQLEVKTLAHSRRKPQQLSNAASIALFAADRLPRDKASGALR